MAFDESTLRADAQGGANPPGGLIPEDAANTIIKEATESSAVMRLARRLPNMSRAQRRLPVLSALPTAYFVNAEQNPSDTRHKRTTKMEWDDVFIDAEEIAVIAPVPENVLADSAFDIWGEMRPAIAEAIGLAFDRAVLYGDNAPNVWPDSLVEQINDANHAVPVGSVGTDLYDDLLGEGGVISFVEEDGYMVNGHLAKLTMRAKLRGLRDANTGVPIFTTDLRDRQTYALDGSELLFPRNGSFVPSDDYELISGDWSRLVFAVRQDITWKLLDQAVITDPTDGNSIVYNLAQQDMVALRVVFRAGWALPNPVNRVNPTEATRLPFAALAPASESESSS